MFDSTGKYVIFNSCDFYDGITEQYNLEKIYDDNFEELGIEIDDVSRVYADIANKDEYIIGDAYGYIKCISTKGINKWTYYVGSSISSIDLSKDGSKLLVGTYAGMLHLLELNSNNKDIFDIENGNVHRIKTWLLWTSQERFMEW